MPRSLFLVSSVCYCAQFTSTLLQRLSNLFLLLSRSSSIRSRSIILSVDFPPDNFALFYIRYLLFSFHRGGSHGRMYYSIRVLSIRRRLPSFTRVVRSRDSRYLIPSFFCLFAYRYFMVVQCTVVLVVTFGTSFFSSHLVRMT